MSIVRPAHVTRLRESNADEPPIFAQPPVERFTTLAARISALPTPPPTSLRFDYAKALSKLTRKYQAHYAFCLASAAPPISCIFARTDAHYILAKRRCHRYIEERARSGRRMLPRRIPLSTPRPESIGARYIALPISATPIYIARLPSTRHAFTLQRDAADFARDTPRRHISIAILPRHAYRARALAGHAPPISLAARHAYRISSSSPRK